MEALLGNLNKERTALNNRLESFTFSGMLDKKLKSMIAKELEHKDGLINKINKAVEVLASQHYAEMLANLESIPGMGKKTAIALIVLSGGFGRFDDYRKLSSYIGICPRLFESGTSIKGKAGICKMGMAKDQGNVIYLFLKCNAI